MNANIIYRMVRTDLSQPRVLVIYENHRGLHSSLCDSFGRVMSIFDIKTKSPYSKANINRIKEHWGFVGNNYYVERDI